eukprot:TRINITY_DN9540_c0_g1_i1.p1 TRINITY_DN9540_c0_g1~~TRINITY_DN9540_c0_g1_i1.p1  ORF type:complete len:130 (-),score=29.68 TRINITY_DN9540_c0_g1_i1:349-738(-)
MQLAMEMNDKKAKSMKDPKPLKEVLNWRVSSDARDFGSFSQVLVGMIPMDLNFPIQSPFSVFPLMLFEGDESPNLLDAAGGIKLKQQHIRFHLSVDLKTFWSHTFLIIRSSSVRVAPQRRKNEQSLRNG